MKALIVGTLWIISLISAYFLGDYFGFHNLVTPAGIHGRFLSQPVVKLLNDRDLELQADFVFIDPNERPWLAPQGSVVNGASIPRPFWTLVGGPLSGKYRNASIIHDVECVRMTSSSHDVHRMFFDACLAGGVPVREAKRLYWAVARFGPRWEQETRVRTVTFTDPNGNLRAAETAYSVSVPVTTDEPTAEDVAWAETYFRENDPPVEIIPNLQRQIEPTD